MGKSLFRCTSYAFSPGTAQLAFSKTVGGIHSTSDCVKSFTNISETVLSAGGPRHCRPSDRFGPPTALFDKALALLKYDLDHLEVFTPLVSEINPSFDLVTTATAFCGLAGEREVVLRSPRSAFS